MARQPKGFGITPGTVVQAVTCESLPKALDFLDSIRFPAQIPPLGNMVVACEEVTTNKPGYLCSHVRLFRQLHAHWKDANSISLSNDH